MKPYRDDLYLDFLDSTNQESFVKSLFEEIDYLNHTLDHIHKQKSNVNIEKLEKDLQDAIYDRDRYQTMHENDIIHIIDANKEVEIVQRKLKLFILAASRFDLLPKLKKEITRIQDEEKNLITFKKFFADTSDDLEKFSDDLDFDEIQQK